MVLSWYLNRFQDIWAFPVRGVQDPRWPWPTNNLMLHYIRNKNINGLGVVIKTVFKIFGHFLFEELEGVRAILKALDINTIWCTLTQETTIHMIWGSGFQLFWGTVGLQISGHFCLRRFYLRTDFLYIFCLIYPEYRHPNPDVLFLPKNTV